MQAKAVCYPSGWRGLVVLQGTYRTVIVSAASMMHDFIPVQPKPISSILLLAELSLDRGSSISGTFEPHPNLVRFFLTFCLTVNLFVFLMLSFFFLLIEAFRCCPTSCLTTRLNNSPFLYFTLLLVKS